MAVSMTALFRQGAAQIRQRLQRLGASPGRTNVNFATRLLPFQRVDCRRGFAVVSLEPVRVDAQRDGRRGMAKTLRNGRDIDALVD